MSSADGAKHEGHDDTHLGNPSASKRPKIDKKNRLYICGKRHEFFEGDPKLFELVLETDRPIVDMGWMVYTDREDDGNGECIPSTRGAYLVFDNGKVKQWGYDYELWANTLSSTTFLSQVTQICCTDTHGAAAQSDGSVVTWGYNDNSQLGRTTNEPTLFHLPERVSQMATHFVTQVACTSCGTIAVTDSGDLFGWGYHFNGELGQPRTPRKITQPMRIDGLPPVKQISATGTNVCALTKDGDVYVWGGLIYRYDNPEGPDPSRPLLVVGELPKNVKQIYCGAFFAGAVTDDGFVYVWGRSRTAKMVESLKFVKIGSICYKSTDPRFEDNALIAVSDDKSRLVSCKNFDKEKVIFRNTEEIPTCAFSGKVSKVFASGGLFVIATEPFENDYGEQQFSSPKLFDNPESHPDIKFTINGDVICSAHKCILSTRSTFFQNLFAAGMKESKQTKIEVNEFSKDVFVRVIQFIYESKFDDMEAHALPSLWEAADFYCLDDLKGKCLKVLEDSIITQNVGELLQAFDDKGLDACKDICMSFLVKNGKEWASQKKYTNQVTSTNLWAEICNALIE